MAQPDPQRKPLKRHPALQDLSRDHRAVLIEAHGVLKAVRRELSTETLAQRVRSLVDFWIHEGVHHIREEEEVLLPVYARHGPPTDDPRVRRMLDDHAWLRDRVPRLEAWDDTAGLTEAVEVAERLRAHVRFEEGELFEHLQTVLSEDDLSDIAAGSLEARRRVRPHSIGPHRGR